MRSVFFLLLFFGLAGCAAKPGVVEFEEINVERINIVSPDGTHRLVIANKDRFPPPVLDGVVLDLPRSVVPAGMVFYDEAGNERGGIGVMEVPGRGEQAGMIFDYQNSEAAGTKAQTAKPTSPPSRSTIESRSARTSWKSVLRHRRVSISPTSMAVRRSS